MTFDVYSIIIIDRIIVRMNQEIETKTYHAKMTAMGEIVFSPVLLITCFCRQEFFSAYREEISSRLKLKS